MKILVIGKGGREHALAYACKRSALCDELICVTRATLEWQKLENVSM